MDTDGEFHLEFSYFHNLCRNNVDLYYSNIYMDINGPNLLGNHIHPYALFQF